MNQRPRASRREIIIVAILVPCFGAAAIMAAAPPSLSDTLFAVFQSLLITAATLAAGIRAWVIFRRGSIILGGLLWMFAVLLMLVTLPSWAYVFQSLE